MGASMRIDLDTVAVIKERTEKQSDLLSKEVGTKSVQNSYIKIEIGNHTGLQRSASEDSMGNQEISQLAEVEDVTLNRNYLTVMSSSMSQEDFAKLEQEGYTPNDMEIEELVTVTDQIKAELLKAGISIKGYTDNLNLDKLKEITGSDVFAIKLSEEMIKRDIPVNEKNITEFYAAYEKQSKIDIKNDSMKKFIFSNQLKPSIENLYLAQYSSSTRTSSQEELKGNVQKSSINNTEILQDEYEQLQKQIDKIVDKSGIMDKESADKNAKWLIHQELPLTVDNLLLAYELDHYDQYMSKESRTNAILQTMSSGEKAENSIFYNSYNIYDKAEKLQNEIQLISETAVLEVAKVSDKTTLRELLIATKKEDENGQEEQIEFEQNHAKNPKAFVTLRLQLEEIRLKMTVEANINMMRRGISIDTTELNQLVNLLRNEEENLAKRYEVNEEEVSNIKNTYHSTLQVIHEIKEAPAALIGKAIAIPVVSLSNLKEETKNLKKEYKEAGDRYEKLMTVPRKDLGDSIKTAFQNIPEILEELHLENTDFNRRAVRILGYNQMELTPENISKVSTLDLEVNTVLQKLTPERVFSMVKEGKNLLEMSMPEVLEYTYQKEESTLVEAEQYAKFLYRLEQDKQITEEEKQAYIGIYRLTKQIEKSDGEVIGQLVRNGVDVNFNSLLSALRSKKSAGTDILIDNETEIITKLIQSETSISSQIGMIEKIREQKMLASAAKSELEQTKGNPENEETNYQIELLQKAASVDEQVVKNLLEFKIPITVQNILAADDLFYGKGNVYKKLAKSSSESVKSQKTIDSNYVNSKTEEDSLEKIFQEIYENFTDKESVLQEFQKLEDFTEKLVNNSISQGANSIDVRSLALTFRQIQICVAGAKDENYEVPVKIGEEITNIHLRIVHNESNKGSVTVSTDTEKYGHIDAEFTIQDDEVKGYLFCKTREVSTSLKKVTEAFSNQLENEKLKVKQEDIQIFTSAKPMMRSSGHERISAQSIETRHLYFVAKSFLYSMQNDE